MKKILLGLIMLSGLAQNSYANECENKIFLGARYSFTQDSPVNGHFEGTIEIEGSHYVNGQLHFNGEVIYTSNGGLTDTFTGWTTEGGFITFKRPCKACWNPRGVQLWKLSCNASGMFGTFGPGGGEMKIF